MFDWVPLENYSAIHYHALFFIVLIIFLHSMIYNIRNQSSLIFFQIFGGIIVVVFTLYMGLRPISGKFFGDMGTYAASYKKLQEADAATIDKDYLFNYLMLASSKVMSAQAFFLLISILYILPCYLFSRIKLGKYWFFGFFMFVGSMSFWPYGVNGIRNGAATSIFILALTFYNNKTSCYALMLLAYGFHNSIAIPLAAFLFADLYKSPKWYLYIWLSAIPLSLFAGSIFQSLLGSVFSDNERSVAYLTKGNINNDNFSSTGFRWDFVLYSSSAVFAGYYYIFKKNIKDRFYIHLYGTFLIANAFWILVIKANFSNRFAYLSWFLMAPVIIYPVLKYKFVDDQYRVVGKLTLAYYLFTYVMYLKS